MRLETVRIVADWLTHATLGVNAQLPNVPRDEGDPEPPELEAIYDVTRHNHVVLRDDPPRQPCLYLTTERGIVLAGEEMSGTHRETVEPFAVVVRYLRVGGVDLAQAVQDGDYTLRAMMRSVMALMENANADSRIRNSVCLVELERATYVPIIEDVGNTQVTGATVLDFKIRDAAPTL